MNGEMPPVNRVTAYGQGQCAQAFGQRPICGAGFIESQKKNVVFSVGAICDAREIRGFSREMAQVKGDNINLTLNSLRRAG